MSTGGMETAVRAPHPAAGGETPGEEAVALEFRDIFAGYGEGPVLRDVSVTVRAGQVTALLGPNGAGKSTLLKTASGLLAPISGTVLLEGTDLTRLPAERRSKMGLGHITEGRGIYRSLTVRENLIMQGRPGETAKAVEQASQAFPILGKRLGQQAGTLSGGEQQMLALAAAYVREPRVLVVDEPSLGLAPIVVDVVFDFLAELHRRGVTLLVVDQFAHRVLALATHAYVLRRGQIVYSGSAEELAKGDVFEQYLGSGGTA